jgi:hypothetical protein
MGESMLTALIAEQRQLEACLETADGSPQQTLTIGHALLSFAAREDAIFSRVAPFFDPAAKEELAFEHREIAEDLELLEWLLSATPGSSDIPVLTASLRRRMRDHIARDGRLLSRAAKLPF